MVDSPARRRSPSKAAQKSAGVRSLVADTLRDAIVDFEIEDHATSPVADSETLPAETAQAAVDPLEEAGAPVAPDPPATAPRRRFSEPRTAPAKRPGQAPGPRQRRRAAEWTERDEFLADMAVAALALEPAVEVAVSAVQPAAPEAPLLPEVPVATSSEPAAPEVTATATGGPAPVAAATPAARARPASRRRPAPAPETADDDRYGALEHLMEVRNRADAAAETTTVVLADLVAQVRSLQEEVNNLRSGDADPQPSTAVSGEPVTRAAAPTAEVVRVGMTRRAALVTVAGVFLAFVLAAVFLLIVVRGL